MTFDPLDPSRRVNWVASVMTYLRVSLPACDIWTDRATQFEGVTLLSYTTVLRLAGSVVFHYKVNICIVFSSNRAASSKLQNNCCLTKMLIQQEARSSMSHVIS